jgi:hypothetical protein
MTRALSPMYLSTIALETTCLAQDMCAAQKRWHIFQIFHQLTAYICNFHTDTNGRLPMNGTHIQDTSLFHEH